MHTDPSLILIRKFHDPYSAQPNLLCENDCTCIQYCNKNTSSPPSKSNRHPQYDHMNAQDYSLMYLGLPTASGSSREVKAAGGFFQVAGGLSWICAEMQACTKILISNMVQ